MNKILLVIVGTIFLNITGFGQIPSLKKDDVLTGIDPITCPFSHDHVEFEVPRVTKNRNLKGGTLSIRPVYAGGIPQGARDALEQTIFPILNETFNSDVEIVVQVNWEQLGSGTLANASSNFFVRNFSPNVIFNVFYPAALAEKIVGRDLNDELDIRDEFDVTININAAVDWCFECSSTAEVGNRFDFVTVLLHEIYHGLGFFAFSGVNNDIAIQTSGGISMVYNHYLENGSGERTITLEDQSPELLSHFTSNLLFFRSPQDERYRIFAPLTYNPGSSISHLNDATYTQTSDALMISTSRPGQVIRDGGIATEILYDLGWVFTKINHEPADPSIENDVNEDYTVSVNIESENGYYPDSVRLHYSSDSFENEDIVVNMMMTGPDEYEAVIPSPGETALFEYFIETYDLRNTRFSAPGVNFNSDQFVYFHSFGLDETKPIITHDPLETVLSVEQSISLFANANDVFTGIDTIYIEWNFNGEMQPLVPMVRDTIDLFEDDRYVGTLQFPRSLNEDDIIEYRIIASDASKAENTNSNPLEGFHRVSVVPIIEASSEYTTTFDDGKEDFTMEGFSIIQAPLFLEKALHSDHPYANAGENRTLNLIAELNIPIILKERGEATLTFDEIVLVEPGEPNTNFGDQEFWDYVIVEGKKLGSSDWIPMVNGYDSQEDNIWNSTYRGGIPAGGQDSNSSGRPNLYRERTIDMVARPSFNAGDTVLIRFRLFSDPFARGWGWAIDNLAIQDVISAVEDYVETKELSIFPNPTSDEIILRWDLISIPDKLTVEVSDVFGRRLLQQEFPSPRKSFRETISLHGLDDGMYLIKISFNQRDFITRKILKF